MKQLAASNSTIRLAWSQGWTLGAPLPFVQATLRNQPENRVIEPVLASFAIGGAVLTYGLLCRCPTLDPALVTAAATPVAYLAQRRVEQRRVVPSRIQFRRCVTNQSPRAAVVHDGGHPAEQCLLSRHKLDEVLADVRSS
jgi:hypothetical protein